MKVQCLTCQASYNVPGTIDITQYRCVCCCGTLVKLSKFYAFSYPIVLASAGGAASLGLLVAGHWGAGIGFVLGAILGYKAQAP